MRPGARPRPLRAAVPGGGPFLEEFLAGLRRPRKRIPCKYFYDERGSGLFESICDLPEYYLTRTELAIMGSHAREMADALGPRCLLVEFGSGNGRKTRLLLDHLVEPAAYVPIDISREALEASAGVIARAHTGLEVRPLCADYTGPVEIPDCRTPVARRAVYFPGSTIGNFTRPEARRFLQRMAAVAGPAGAVLIGVDLEKEPTILEAAYDDAQGLTAAFNLNLLARANRELGAGFRLDLFRHRAAYDRRRGRIVMHLVSLQDQAVSLAGERIHLARGEAILTEYSYKYTVQGFARLASRAGLDLQRAWTDPRRWFAVLYLEAARRAAGAPALGGRAHSRRQQRHVPALPGARPKAGRPRLPAQRPLREGHLVRPVQ